jgi:hypothetical protein
VTDKLFARGTYRMNEQIRKEKSKYLLIVNVTERQTNTQYGTRFLERTSPERISKFTYPTHIYANTEYRIIQ